MTNDPNDKDVTAGEVPQTAAETPIAVPPENLEAAATLPSTVEVEAVEVEAVEVEEAEEAEPVEAKLEAEAEPVETSAADAADEAAMASAEPTAEEEPVTEESITEAPIEEPTAEEPQQITAPLARRKAREMTGVVSSDKADKTITVRVDRRVKHPVYGKFIRRSTKLAVHDPNNHCREGDVVTIVETRPISKTKSWRLGRIVERANV